MLVGRGEVDALPVALGDHGHELGTETPGAALGTYVFQVRRRVAGQAPGTGLRDRPVRGSGRRAGLVVSDGERDPLPRRVGGVGDDGRDDVRLLALLLAQPPGADQGHLDAAGGVGAGDGAGPDPGDDRGLGAVGEGGPGVEMADALLGLVAHPGAVGAHVGGQALGALPGADLGVGQAGVDGRLVAKLGWDLDERLVDEDGDGVEVGGVRLQAESLGLQGDGATARERVEDRWWLAIGGLEDLGVRLGEQLLVTDVLPHHKPLDQLVQPLALLALQLLRGELLGPCGRVVDELGEQHGARSREGTARPPQVQRGGVSVPDGLLPGGLPVDRLQRQRDLDQLAFLHDVLFLVPGDRLGGSAATNGLVTIRTGCCPWPTSWPSRRAGRWPRSRRGRWWRRGRRGSGPRRAAPRAGRP